MTARRLFGRAAFLAAALAWASPTGAQEELLADPVWEYRLGEGALSTNVPPAAAALPKWPQRWTTFTRWEHEAGTPPRDDDPAAFTGVPTEMTLNGISACRATLPLYGPGVLDFTVGQGAPGPGRWAYAFGTLKADRDQDVILGVRASGPMTLWVDGQLVLRGATAEGRSSPLSLRRGEHVVAARVESGEREWNLTGCLLPARPVPQLDARCVRPAARPAAPPGEARIPWGPVLSRTTDRAAIVVFRLDAFVPVTLRVDGREFPSTAGRFHTWTVDGLRPATAYPYTVTPAGGAARGGTLRALPASGRVTIGLAGDPQSGKLWAGIAAALRKAAPDMVVLLGDLVADGLAEASWGQTLFGPGADLLANVPCLAVAGNHDRRSPVLDRFFTDAAGGPNWAQPAGESLLVGIDGALDWSPAGPHAKWLDATLAGAKSSFVFVVMHYPMYSSRNHGKLAYDGRVLERATRIARVQIRPLLEKHRVTAVFAGHDHGYERSELPSGLTAVVTAGAGAGVYQRRNDPQQNPFSKVLADKHHYTLVRVEGDTAVMTAVTTSGEVLDTRTWKAADRKRRE